MSRDIDWIKRPGRGADLRTGLRERSIGLALGAAGVLTVAVATIGNLTAGGNPARAVWTFGATTAGLGLVKTGIAIVLVGIVLRLWLRVDSVKESLARMKGRTPPGGVRTGDVETPFGPATSAATSPDPLPIHRMARAMWLPALVMGVMAVAVGFVFSLAASAQDPTIVAFRRWSALSQGTMFLGETFLLAGISFLLGTILSGLREGGGEVQEELGVAVKTLRMPTSAKAFIALMATGMMIGIAQFVLYLVGAANAGDPGFVTTAAWLGPLREVGLGVMLAGIVLALHTIAGALGFQFSRIRELIATGA